ncbi:hypothetical protein E2562_030700 [Oryza meyeriana var. granulata]|uniref:Protein ARMADILLO REPEAT KINESIN1 n=1 Tax=Oryza meyeriana var. granulata TaxID=110450 RepID=A0A6G1DQA0_9ORYZ|nr:hypothetical protein E2562_030700 [Oryza meyeriana var. granulata]
MNFLYRTSQPVVPELPRIPEQDHHRDGLQRPATTLEGLIADDPYQPSASIEDGATNNGVVDIGGDSADVDSKNPVPTGKHTDVLEDEGWITIPNKELPDDWNGLSDTLQLQPLDRPFLFPGEQVHILACLSASKQDAQVISPFRIAAVMSKNGNSLQHSTNKSSHVTENGDNNGKNGENGSQVVEDDMQSVELNGEMSPSKQDILETETLLRLEDHKQQIESMLQRFKNSNFFVRIAESDESLWSKKRLAVSKVLEEQSYSDSQENTKASRSNAYNTISDKGVFDGSTSGGVARGTARCYALQNGDIVVVLQVNVGVNKMDDPVLEVLQFEKPSSSNYITANLVSGVSSGDEDPCKGLLSWLLPLDRTLPPCSLSPPTLNPSASHKQSYSSSGSQIFSLSHFRSYSMPSASSTQPPNIRPPPISESQEFVPEKPAKTPDIINDGQLSFRGVPLEPERYSVRCGLEGVYLPGKRWRRKVKIIQPIEVHSFAAKYTAENLLSVLIKNIAPQHVKDIVVFVDAITIVFEEASKGGAPLSLPIASIEVGHGHSLPNIALRRGEEHSFILKPASMSRGRRTNSDAPLTLPLPKMNGTATNGSLPKVGETSGSFTDQYAVLVSYRCNYTESKLFFKQATSWRPCVASDLMISVSSELSLWNPIPSARVPQLPVQVLTLEATNMTSENLTVTVLAPEASGSSSVVSLNSAPTTPNSSYDNLNESMRRSGLGKHRAGFQRLNSVLAGSPNESDNGRNRISTSRGCTHLWLQSAVPLGCIPARSSTTVKLELLPLTDGIITLDTLQITIREKDSCRVRVAVRLRPKNSDDLAHGADFDSCVELQPECKKLKLKRNNWSCESYKFDEVFSENASQKRVYEVVAKPSVLEGYNGTVMAYGQTGTGKTYTVGRLGKDDPSERGIMVRALEHILSVMSLETDRVAISFLQLYLESVQDLLAPEKTNIPIVEDPKTGEVSLPGAAIVEIRDIEHVFRLLQIGEMNRHAANTKMNTESSRSHAILIIHIQRSSRIKDESATSLPNGTGDLCPDNLPLVLKSKLLIVDLAGSERINKSGSEGHMIEEAKFINLSLTSLGKCINALAENSPHIPTRDSKLTRMLRDSFGGTARTSLIVTIGPSARHFSETSSTIMFGQRAMKIVNTIRIKEEVDYESLYKKVEREVDHLTSEMERQQKLKNSEKMQLERKLKESEASLNDLKVTSNVQIENMEMEKCQLESTIRRLMLELEKEKGKNNLLSEQIIHLETSLDENKQKQLENISNTNILVDATKSHEKKIRELLRQLEDERSHSASMNNHLNVLQQQLSDAQSYVQENMACELEKQLSRTTEEFASQIRSLKEKVTELISEKELVYEELKFTQEKMQQEMRHRQGLEDEILRLKQSSVDNCSEETKALCGMVRSGSGLGSVPFMSKSEKSRELLSSQRGNISKIFEEVGLPNVLALLKSEELEVQIHAVKVVANLAAEDFNQEKIIEEGGLDALLSLLETSENTTIHRVTAGAIANLAMNGSNQGLIMNKGGARLLANVASKTDDPQTLRMVAGALANLCGNEKLHVMLKQDGGIKALLGMFRTGHNEVIAQIARGMANFAKCESRVISQGHRKGRSILIEEGVLNWMVANSSAFSASTRRHIELAFCHLAQNEDNARDIILTGGIKELLRISRESSRDDTRNLAKKALNSNPAFLKEIQ